MGDFSADWLALREPADARSRAGHLVNRLLAYGSTLSTGTADGIGVAGAHCHEGSRPTPTGGDSGYFHDDQKLPATFNGPGCEGLATGVSPDPLKSMCLPKDRALANPLDPACAATRLSWHILDLGCGTGSNLRYLAPRLGAGPDTMAWRRQAWWCLDQDSILLAILERRTWPTTELAGDLELTVRTLRQDLAAGLGQLPLPLGPRTLVTASALLDLVSAHWLAGLLRACAASASPLLLVLTYDGRMQFSPAHPSDGTLLALFNAHQRRDKGLGPALGPTAPDQLAFLADEWGFTREVSHSDWVLGPGDTELVTALIEGWVVAAREQAETGTGGNAEGVTRAIRSWRETRLMQNAAGELRLRVGHQDALLLPGFRPHT